MRIALLLLLSVSALAAQDRWAPLSFLIGAWVGEGGGGSGQGTGSFSFLTEQDGKILVRRNRADYPAAKDKPAYSHTDLMIVYSGGAKLHAIYFDNEDHVINYEVASSQNSVQFVNRMYRLTYSRAGPELLSIRFEIADKTGTYKTYIEAKARREKVSK